MIDSYTIKLPKSVHINKYNSIDERYDYTQHTDGCEIFSSSRRSQYVHVLFPQGTVEYQPTHRHIFIEPIGLKGEMVERVFMKEHEDGSYDRWVYQRIMGDDRDGNVHYVCQIHQTTSEPLPPLSIPEEEDPDCFSL